MSAPGSTRVTVEGVDRLVRTLKRAGVDISDLKAAHSAVAAFVAGEAAARAPRRSGALAGSVRGARLQSRARVSAGRSSIPYAGPIHWGWPARRISSQPFVSEAAQATEPRWSETYRRDVLAALEKVQGA